MYKVKISSCCFSYKIFMVAFDLICVFEISISQPIIIIHGSAGGFVKAYKCILHPTIRRAHL